LLQCTDSIQKVFAENVQPRGVQTRRREEVDHFARIHRVADDLPHGLIGDLLIGDLLIGDLLIGDLLIGDLLIGDLKSAFAYFDAHGRLG